VAGESRSGTLRGTEQFLGNPRISCQPGIECSILAGSGAMASGNFLENLVADLRHAVRVLWRSKAFTATAVAALALGIGANTAIFSVVNAVLLQPLSYPQPDRLVALQRHFPDGTGRSISIPKFIVWREQTQVFQSVAAYDFEGPGINLTGGDLPQQVKGIHASYGYFDVFGAPFALGRPYSADEDRPDGPKVIVISNGLWRSRYAGDPNILGKTIEITGDPYQVIGVLGPSFKTDPKADVWIPLQPDPNSANQGHFLRVAARMRPGVTLTQANAAMQMAAEEFHRKFPNATFTSNNESAVATPLRDTVVSDIRKALLILLGAVGFVLLIACANVANLLLARATLRKREIAIRSALGASRGRVVMQLLTESVLLSLIGGALGLLLGYAGVRTLLAVNPVNLPRIDEHGANVSLDWRVLAFTLLVALFTGVLFGLIPALSGSRTDLTSTFKEGSSRAGSSFRQNKARSILVITEMALALVLLVGAALLIRTYMSLRDVKPGFDAHNVLTMEMSFSGDRFKTTAPVTSAAQEVERRVDAIPGIEAVAMTCCLPATGGVDLPFTIEGVPPGDGGFNGDDQWRNVSPEYFQVFRIPLLRGRQFDRRDQMNSDHVVVINEAMAKKYWPKGNELGARITIGHGLGPEFEEGPRQVVGVVGDTRDDGLDNDPPPVMYIPQSQSTDGETALESRVLPVKWIIRTKVVPLTLSNDVQRELRVATGGLPVAHVRTMIDVVGESTARSDFNTMLLSIFAGVALLLAAIGIYGLMAYSVQQRTQEIGIRMALGASPATVRKMVVFQGMRLAAIGVVIGVAAALALTRFMADLIFGVKTWDPVVFVTITVLLASVSFLATYIPAVRASRVDPMESLRYE
jgi:putative ABC transport system permease protein